MSAIRMDNLMARGRMYEILTSAFYPPSEELKADIMSGEFVRRIEEATGECCDISAQCCLTPEFLEEIREISSAAGDDEAKAEFSDSLDAEYVRLFVNDFPTLCAPPYESFYHEGRVMGKAAIACRLIYEEDGLTLQEEGELPDHIVSQLEYLLFLCLAEQNAVGHGDVNMGRILRERERGFYQQHIMTWVPEFCTRIQAQSSVPYYRVMARFLKTFTALENRNLHQEQLNTVRGGSAQ